MNKSRMRVNNYLPMQRRFIRPEMARKVFLYYKWGDGFWYGLGYWKTRTRKGEAINMPRLNRGYLTL